MAVNYDDERFTEVESQKSEALKDLDKTYNGMVSESQKGYNEKIQASKDWVKEQTKLQNEETDFAIEEINQQKEQTEKDYIKEQSGAYTDWQKQSNQYGVNAEQKASMGVANSGYSESSLVSMYNTYQNRVAAARESYSRAVLNYDNAIKEARLQNNSLLAEIAYKGLQEQLSLGIEAMQYKNSLLIQKASEKRAIDSDYYNRWKDVLSQINTENTLAEQKRQFNEQMAFQKEQFNWQKAQASKTNSGSIKKTSTRSKVASEVAKAGAALVNSKKSTKTGESSTKKKSYTAGQKSSNELKVDTASLIKAGYAGKSAREIDQAVRQGYLMEIVDPKSGTIKYQRTLVKPSPGR